MSLPAATLQNIARQFLYYKTLGEKAMDQLEPSQWLIQLNEDSNSMAMLVQHLSGNMLSRWTDFRTTDGEKEWRQRDLEFEPVLDSPEAVRKAWDQGWTCFLDALNSIQPEELGHTIYIRNDGHTILDALLRQLAHYPYHIGQMIYLAKVLKQSPWQSLSIPRNNSAQYNSEKFAREKSTRHFTDDELNKLT